MINHPCHMEIQGDTVKKWWRTFIRKCHVLGLAKKQLRSIIKKSQHYGIQGIINKTDGGISALESGQQLLLPQWLLNDDNNCERLRK